MGLRDGILASARSLGVNPLDLATAISYETAGTFDPTKRGPTTQWGQHQGLIQFGQPQAKQYGVDWDDPIGSQLGEDGAVVRYLRDTGVKPGMGLLDIYSAINAGGVGRYNRSDANNGGAPGTVADKVKNQMAGHRKKAMALLGEDEQIAADAMQAIGRGPALSTSGSAAAIGSEGNDRMTPQPQQRGLLSAEPEKSGLFTPEQFARFQMAVEGMSLRPNQGIMKAAEATLTNSADKKKANRTAEWLAQNGRDDLAQAVASGAIDAKTAVAEAMKKPEAKKPIQVNGQLVDPDTYQVIGDFRDPDKPAERRIVEQGGVQYYADTGEPVIENAQPPGVDPKDESSFRKEYTGLPAVKSFAEQGVALGRVRASAKDATPAGDLALIFNFMKVLDPGSVVREGEFATAAKAGSYGERIAALVGQVEKGTKLSEPQRADFVKRAEMLYNDALKQAHGLRTQYTDEAERLGYNVEGSVPDFAYRGEYAPEAAPRPGTRPVAPPAPEVNPVRGKVEQAIQQLSPMDRKVFDALSTPAEKANFLEQRGLL